MKVQLLVLTSLISTSLSAVESIDCASPQIFCTTEYSNVLKNTNTLEEAVDKLPQHVKRNLTFKRGTNITKSLVGYLGPHGHRVSKSNSGSASPTQPRVIVWDEMSGFTASWNSGNPNHRAHDRIDLYDFDFKKKEHRLMAWFPSDKKKIYDASFVDSSGSSCIGCHGDVQRPIFPMYPDWPQFYGEFNDEMDGYSDSQNALRIDLKNMANDYQPKETKSYFEFLETEAYTNPRFSTLYDAKASKDIDNKYYPYRPDNTTSPFAATSRAFANRPNLRLGVLYNRLTALQTFEKIKKSPVFQKFPDIIFYSLLDCNWDFVENQGQYGRADILGKMVSELHKNSKYKGINLRGAKFKSDELSSTEKKQFFKEGSSYYSVPKFDQVGFRQIPYEDLLKLLDLKIEDLDIRFKHNSSLTVDKAGLSGKKYSYGIYDSKAFYNTNSVMDIGYVDKKYKLNPICDNAGTKCDFSYDGTYIEGMKYFNSYFDGSAAMNELLAAQMLIYLTSDKEKFNSDSDLASVRELLKANIKDPSIYFETLNKKYSHYTARMELDQDFFDKMDKMSPWIQLPYPPDLLNVHNREAFWSSTSKTTSIRMRHAQWRSESERKMKSQNRNGGNNICWNVYTSMHKRYR